MMAGAKATPSRSGPGPNNQDGKPTATWEEWVFDSTASSDVNRTPITDMLVHALNRLPDGTVSKQQIAQAFLDWLRTADNVIATARERYTQ